MPRVTVVTPTYNHASYIGSCIESVLAQTFDDWEMIIVDDGSTDGTGEIVQSYTDPRIRYIRKEHAGINGLKDSYNLATSLAQGDLIAILEGDDFWPKRKLAIQVPDFDDPVVTLSAGQLLIYNTTWKTYQYFPNIPANPETRINRPVGSAAALMVRPNVLTYTFPVTVITRKAAIHQLAGFRQPHGLPLVDYPTLLHLTLTGEWRIHSEYLGIWRRHGGSVTKSSYPTILNGVYQEVESFLAEHPLKQAEMDEIDTLWRNFQLERCIVLSRLLASKGDHAKSLGALQAAQRFPLGKKTKLILSAARLLTAMRMSPEPLWRFAKRGHWKPEQGFESEGLIVTEDTPPESLVYRKLGPKPQRSSPDRVY